MARSSTTYAPKWKAGKTRVIRVPENIADRLLEIARTLDEEQASQVRENGVAYQTLPNGRLDREFLNQPVNVSKVPQRSPFRYPGGKTWLVPILRAWLRSLPRKPDFFLEPFAGGGIASLTVAFERLAGGVVMAETDEGVAAVWKTILNGQAEWLARRILEYDLTLDNVKRTLDREKRGESLSLKDKAFLTILRNRVQRGGIMAPGAGLVKTGENNRGISSRWYPSTLARRIREIAVVTERLRFHNGDGLALVREYLNDSEAAMYLDPPYVKAGRRLYNNWQVDHRAIFDLMSRATGPFLMSYDNNVEIRELAAEFGFSQQPIKMKNTHHAKMTELLISNDLRWLGGAKRSISSKAESARNQSDLLECRP